MILSLLIWYFILPQLCSPHCTTCVYCLKHTCQIKEQLMHLIFNYCPPQPPAHNGKMSKRAICRVSPRRSAQRHGRALMHARGTPTGNLNSEQELKRFPALGALSWHIPLVWVKTIHVKSVHVINHYKKTRLFKIQIVKNPPWLCRF